MLSANRGLLGPPTAISLGETGLLQPTKQVGWEGQNTQEPHEDRKQSFTDGSPAGFKMYHAKARGESV